MFFRRLSILCNNGLPRGRGGASLGFFSRRRHLPGEEQRAAMNRATRPTMWYIYDQGLVEKTSTTSGGTAVRLDGYLWAVGR